MEKKDILELKKRLKKDDCTFTRVSGCYVNYEKDIILNLNKSFLNLEDEEYFKYLEIAKKVLSGTIDNTLLELNFSKGEESYNKQMELIALKKSKLKNEDTLNDFYRSIIDNYDYEENYLILLFHDVYDIMSKTSDMQKLDESEEVFEYVICAICPVSLSEPALGYFKDENTIKSRLRDWIVGPPINGFLYPAFIDRTGDVNSLIYYSKNPKDTHPELMKEGLGCSPRETMRIQKEKFKELVSQNLSPDKEEAKNMFLEIQGNLNGLIEDNINSLEPGSLKLTEDKLEKVLLESGLPEEETEEIKDFYLDNFKEEFPKVENLLDKKSVELGQQKKKEKLLERELDILREKLDSPMEESNLNEDYDIILQARSNKIEQIKSQVIDGQEYIMIPVSEEEKTIINEIKAINK